MNLRENANEEAIRSAVRERYAGAACAFSLGRPSGCGGPEDPVTRDLYGSEEAALLPEEALRASLGCGNPTALAELREGEVVLDLGSGAGLDVLLSARRVGPTGKAYGLDMTPDMLALARENQRKAGVENVEFLEGAMEAIPLPDASVDVIISNCVVNLSADKDRVLREAFRVLRPGGRLAVADVVVRGTLPPAVRRSLELWAGCVAGALEEHDYLARLAAAGFTAANLTPTRIYTSDDLPSLAGSLMSAFVRATKPLA